MQVSQDITDLNHPADHISFGQESARLRQDRLQVSSLKILQDEIAVLPLNEIVIDLNDSRMTQGRQDIRLTVKTAGSHRPNAGIARCVAHLLDRT